MDPLQELVAGFAEDVRDRFVLMQQLDVPRALADVRAMPTLKKVEWLLRCRAPLRICLGVLDHPEMFPRIFAPDHENHTVLCLLSDLLEHLLRAPGKPPLIPVSESLPPGLPRTKVLHLLLYRAELDQDFSLGLALA